MDRRGGLRPPRLYAEMVSSPLFRPEVLASRREAWLGEAQLVQPLPIKLVSSVCLILTSALVLFLAAGFYTRRVHATGILAPKTGLITIASPTAGRIMSAGAREGDKVEKGQLLYVVDVDAVSASGPTQKLVQIELMAQKASVERGRQTRMAVASIEKQGLKDQLANTIVENTGIAHQVTLQKQLTQSLKDRADQLKEALGTGIARASDVQNQNYLYIQANAQLAQFQQNGIQLDGKIADFKAKIAAFDDNLSREVAEMDRAIAQLQQQIAESDAKQAIEIRAPEQGILTSLRVNVGQQVAAGGPLLTLLPNTGNLEAQLYVDSSAIGFVDAGEPVMLRYAAFPFQRFGLYRGTVSEVTRAPVGTTGENTVRNGEDPQSASREGLYRITVKPDRGWVMALGEKRGLEAGMRVEADIAIEKRPLYRWLLDPVYHLRRSAKLVTEGATP